MSVTDSALPTEAPDWLPAALTGIWDFLAAYPPILALVVLVVGLALAIVGRMIALHWGGLFWVNHPSQRGPVSHELYMKVYKALGQAGIEIPFPQRDVWMRGKAED